MLCTQNNFEEIKAVCAISSDLNSQIRRINLLI